VIPRLVALDTADPFQPWSDPNDCTIRHPLQHNIHQRSNLDSKTNDFEKENH
jgi:hypothetical protein